MPPFNEASPNSWSNQGMQKLIPIIDEIQDGLAKAGLSESFHLPQIAVIGSQSAGKTSTLESIVGIGFLPRGTGMVTRTPIKLELKQNKSIAQDMARFRYQDDPKRTTKEFTDFNLVRQEIEAETKRLAGEGKGISSTPIVIEIHSRHVPNLTLIDLPGIVRNQAAGQPDDIEQQIRKITLQYIQDPMCLILAITEAYLDLANSEAIKMAREVDPEGNRTIGVLTKMDALPAGADAREVLENQGTWRLKRGYIGVCNRSELDIKGNRSIQECWEKEKNFFRNHDQYRHLASKQGTPYLQQTLNQQLVKHIRDNLPRFRDALLKCLQPLKPFVDKYLVEQNKTLDHVEIAKKKNHIVQKFIRDLEATMDGSHAREVTTDELTRGVYVKRILHVTIPERVFLHAFNTPEIMKEIQTCIENVHGGPIGRFVPDKAFRLMAKKLIRTLLAPAEECIQLVAEQVSMAIREVAALIQTYPRLRNAIETIAITELREKTGFAIKQTRFLFNCELSYMNTRFKDFPVSDGQNERDLIMMKKNIGVPTTTRAAIEPAVEALDFDSESHPDSDVESSVAETPQLPLNDDLQVVANTPEAKKVLELLEDYLPVVVERLRDLVLRFSWFTIIEQLIEFLQAELAVRLDEEKEKNVLMEESEFEVEQREKTLREYEAINKALETISKTNTIKFDVSSKVSAFEKPVMVARDTRKVVPPLLEPVADVE